MTLRESVIKTLKEKKVPLTPCSNAHVLNIESYYKVKLPSVYVEFLLNMGLGAGKYLAGDDCFYNDIFNIGQWAKETIDDNNFIPLPGNAFVFWMHQGYQFAFFSTDESDNPTVYYFSEGENMKEYRNVGTLIEFYFVMLRMSGIIE